MSVVAPKVFRQSDSGAPALSGQVGTLIEVFDSHMIINRQFTAVSGGTFVNNTTEARLEGGTAFVLFQGPTQSNDEAYFGMSQKFERLRFDFATPGVQNAAITLTWEFWNGSAWTSFTPDSDGTNELTQDGSVVWVPANLTGWVANSVNSVTLFWVRVRFTAGSWTTNPTVNYVTAGGWTKAFSGTNTAAYRQGGGNQFYLNVNDNGPGAGGAREARLTGFETMSAIDTGTGQFPTNVQSSIGIGAWVARKSTTADATARNYILVCDDRGFILFTATGDTAGVYYDCLFGDIHSRGGSGDGYRTIIIGRVLENSNSLTQTGFMTASLSNATVGGHHMARSYTGTGTSIAVGKHGHPNLVATTITLTAGSAGLGTQYPNGPDGALCLSRIAVTESANNTLRGRLRGIWQVGHFHDNFADADVFQGVGAEAGKTFLIVKQLATGGGNNSALGIVAIETSDTWETN